MSESDIDSFASMFKAGPGGEPRRKAMEARAKAERRAQLSEKQLRRRAVRTEQINFRCSPEFRQKVKAVAAELGWSIADVLEAALDDFAEAKARKGKGKA